MKKNLVLNLLILTMIFLVSAFSVQSLGIGLDTCQQSTNVGDLESNVVTTSAYCINVTFRNTERGDDEDGGPTNVSQCVFTAVGPIDASITIGTNSTSYVNLTADNVNSTIIIWDTTASSDQNLTSVTASCTVNVTQTITNVTLLVVIDNTVPTSTYAGETPRDGATVDDDFVIIESTVDDTIVECLLIINNTVTSGSTTKSFAPLGDKCTTRDLTETKNLNDDATYTYSFRSNDGLNNSQFSERTFQTRIRSASFSADVDDGVTPTLLSGKGGIIGIIIIIVLIAAVGGGLWFKSQS